MTSYAADNPTKVGKVVLACPALDIASLHDTNFNGYGTAEMEATYGGSLSAYQAALATKNPINRTSDLAALPILLYHGAPADNVCPLATLNTFATNTGAEIHSSAAQSHTPDVVDLARLKAWLP